MNRIVGMSLILIVLVSCEKPHFECRCVSLDQTDSFNEINNEAISESSAEDWCNDIQSNNQEYNCNLAETFK